MADIENQKDTLEECPICLDDIKNIVIYKICGHFLCKECFSKYIKTKASLDCHMCRTNNIDKVLIGGKEKDVCFKSKNIFKRFILVPLGVAVFLLVLIFTFFILKIFL